MATMENGVPSHDTFGRVFRLLDAKRFEQAFRGWIRSEWAPRKNTLRSTASASAAAITGVSEFPCSRPG
jgi:hypothetical protein